MIIYKTSVDRTFLIYDINVVSITDGSSVVN